MANLRHVRVNKEGIATFGLELDLKSPESKIYLYKVSLGHRGGGLAGLLLARGGSVRGMVRTRAVGPAPRGAPSGFAAVRSRVSSQGTGSEEAS